MKGCLIARLLALGLFCSMIPSIGLAGIDEGLTAYKNKDYATALREILPHATGGNAYAQNIIGVMYAKGQGVPQDNNEAVRWYRLAAEQGDAAGQSNLGVRYGNGQGLPQNDKEAVKWYRLSADQGYAAGQFNLGQSYANGGGVPQNDKEAVKWYRLAAEQGHAAAQVSLGQMYQNGQGVPQDYKEAEKWYRLAADQGHPAGQVNLGLMYGNGQGLPQNDKEAVKWYRLSADQGFAAGQFNLGQSYAYGGGVPKNDKEAEKWYRLAAEQGYADAQYNLGVMYTNGQGVPQDYKEAMKWYRLAAEQGNAAGKFNLGVMYANGHGVPRNDKEAVKWYRLAAEQGHADGQYNLGIMYETGTGVTPNRVVAYALYAISGTSEGSENRKRLANSMRPSEIEGVQEWFPEVERQGGLLKALDILSNKSFEEIQPETIKGQNNSAVTPPSVSHDSQDALALWVTMALIWAIVEGIGAIQKKEFRKRLQSAALWATVVTSLTTVGQMKTEQNSLIQLSICLLIYGAVAGGFYFARIKLHAYWQTNRTTDRLDSPASPQEGCTQEEVDTNEYHLDGLEELKKRQERLLLEQDVARLERYKHWAGVTNRWRWLWVGPLGLLGLVLLAAALNGMSHDGIRLDNILAMFLSVAALAPVAAKSFMLR